MTEFKENFDENVSEEKNSEIKTDKVHDNEVGKNAPLSVSTPKQLDIKSGNDEMTNNFSNQTNPPTNLNVLADDDGNSSNSSAILNNDKKTSSPDIPIVSNSDRDFNSSTTLNESTNSSPEISTISNQSNNDKQNSSSDTFTDDKQFSSIIPKDDKQTNSPNIPEQTSSHDGKQISSPSTSDDDKKINSSTSSPILIDDEKVNSPTTSLTSNDNEKANLPTTSPTSNDDKKVNSPTVSPISDKKINSPTTSFTANDDKKLNSPTTSSTSNDKKLNSPTTLPAPNDDKKTNSPITSLTSNDDKKLNSPTTSLTSNDDKKLNSPTTSPAPNDDKKVNSPTVSPISDKKITSPTSSPILSDNKKINSPTSSPILSDNKKINSPTTSLTSNDDKKVNSPTVSPISDKKINSPTSSPISNKLYDDKQMQTTSNEYLYDDSKESSDTNKDSSKHNPSEDNNLNAIMNESEIQQEKEQNQLTGTSLHGDRESFNTSDDDGFEFVQNVKPADSMEFSFVREFDNDHTESSRLIEDPSKHEYNKTILDEKSSNNEIAGSNSDDDEYDDDDDSHKESEHTERMEGYKTIEEETQFDITDNNEFRPDSQLYTEPKKNEVQVADQRIRNRRQQHQESSSPSENIPLVKDFNDRTDTRHTSISFSKIFRNILFSILFFAVIYFIYDVNRLSKKPSSLRNIADITDNIFEEINSVELPVISTISDYAVGCRRAAITVERCAPFKSHGSQIAKGLHEINDAIMKSKDSLQYMYSKGSTLRSSFESEIEAILQRLNSNHIRHDDARYVRDRIDKLTKKIKNIRLFAEKSHNSILDVKKVRINIDDDIKNGLKDAEKFNKNEKYSPNIDKAKKEIENVDDILSKLYTNVGHLGKLREILNDYEGKLMGVLDELDELGDKGARILKADIKHLRVAVENTKVRNHIFNKLSNTD